MGDHAPFEHFVDVFRGGAGVDHGWLGWLPVGWGANLK